MAFTRGASERTATALEEEDDAAVGAIADEEELREDCASLGTESICVGSELTDEAGTEITFPEGRRSSHLPVVPDDATTDPEDGREDGEEAGREEDDEVTCGGCCGDRTSPISAADASRGVVFCLSDISTTETTVTAE